MFYWRLSPLAAVLQAHTEGEKSERMQLLSTWMTNEVVIDLIGRYEEMMIGFME